MSDYDGSMEDWGTDDDQATFSGNPFESQVGYEDTLDTSGSRPIIGSETPGEPGHISGINTEAFAPRYGTTQGADYTYSGIDGDTSGKTAGSGSDSKNILQKLLDAFKDKGSGARGGLDALLAMYAIQSALKDRGRRQDARGYQGKVNMGLRAVQPTNIPAARAYGEAVMGQPYQATTYAAEGGLMGLAAGGLRDGAFVIPADVVSHFGNGSSEAGLAFLAKKLGATPIKGKGDGMSDSIDTTIEGRQPAKVANEEALVSPEKVAALGKGDPKKGAKALYAMMDRVRHARTGTKKQGKQIKPDKYAPGGLAGYASGGAVAFTAGGATTTPATDTSVTSNLSNWAGEYVTDMLSQGAALGNQPYKPYTGTWSAGTSPLQRQAFGVYGGMQASPYFAQAGNIYNQAAAGLAGLDYTSGRFANQFQGPAAYKTGQFNAGFRYAPTNFTNQYKAPTAYKATKFDTGLGGVKSVEGYMNPYMQNVTDIAAREARRQSDISRLSDAARLSSAGAFGGSRQAMMEAEGRRNLGTQIGDIQAKGLEAAYSSALQQRLAESDRSIAAQRAAEESKQYGYGQGMNAAQLMAQYGLSAQQAAEASKQFGAKTAADYRMDAQRAAEASRQFGYGKGLESAQSRAQYGLAALRDTEASRQFGATQDLNALNARLNAAQGLGALGTSSEAANLARARAMLDAGGVQRDIDKEGVAAERAKFEQARAYPYEQLKFMQSLLSGLPISTTSSVGQSTDMEQLTALLQQIYGIGEADTPPPPPATPG